MRYVAAYLLAVLGGNDKPSAAEIKKILSSVGIDADDAAIKKVTSELGGKNINELIEAGRTKLATVPSGGGAVAASPSGGGGAAATEAAPAEDKKAKEESEEEEEDEDMGFGLFD